MSLQSVTVRRARKRFMRGKNYSSESWAIDTGKVVFIMPSLSKKDGQTDGLVASKIRIDDGDGPSSYTELWVTEAVGTIEELDN